MPEIGRSGEPALVIPGLRSFYDSTIDIAWVIVRVTAGLMLLPHGWLKLMTGPDALASGMLTKLGFEPALPLAYLITFLETAGGILIAIGLFTRPIAVLLVIEFIVMTVTVHLAKGWYVGSGGVEFVILWGLLFVAIAIRGGGPWSVDRAIGREI